MTPDDPPPATSPAGLVAALTARSRPVAMAVAREVEAHMAGPCEMGPDGGFALALAAPERVTPAVLAALRAHYALGPENADGWLVEWDEPVLTFTPAAAAPRPAGITRGLPP